MSLTAKVVFPIPPPTTNDLSSQQRTQLLRKAKKLEQIFGVTPRLVDNNTLEPTGPIHVAFPQRRLSRTWRESIDSNSSTSSCESPSFPGERNFSVSSNPHSMSNVNSFHSRASSPSTIKSINSFDTWPGKAKGRLVRVVLKAPTLDTIPVSPSPNIMSSPNSSLQSPKDRNLVFTQVTVIPDEDAHINNPTILDSHNVTSLNSLRKQKMDRVRRKLGQDVPFDLVFPSDAHSGPSIKPDLSAVVKEEFCPPPLPRVKKSLGRISTTRDSVAEIASVHRAKRQAQPSSISKSNFTHNRPDAVLSDPTQRLSFILEGLDEHGTGCGEEFGHSRKPGNNIRFKSGWTVSTGGTEVKLWSTRSGYEGWRPSPPSKTSQMPHMSPPLPSNGSKKKPSSYRKPAPPISDDCY